MNPFQVERLIQSAREIAERNGFCIKEHRHYPNKISILATKLPYADDVVIRAVDRWEDVILFFMGYEQHSFEQKFNKEQ